MREIAHEVSAVCDATGGAMRGVDRALTLVALFGGGITLCALTALSVFNVLVMRKVLNAPIKGAEDVMVLALLVLVAFAIPFGARTGAHVEVEVLEPAMSRRFARLSLLAMKVLGVAMLAVTAWALLDAGSKASAFGESSQTLLIPFEPFYYLLSFWIALYGVVLVLESGRLAVHGSTGRIETPGEESRR
jgi:TRAP-type C4-dicarboxylate transport system permease small subunit